MWLCCACSLRPAPRGASNQFGYGGSTWSITSTGTGAFFASRRAWSKGKETRGKTEGAMKPVAMHPALATYLKAWRNEKPCIARMGIGSSPRIARRGESRGQRQPAGRIIFVPRLSKPAFLREAIGHGSAGTTYGTVWRRFLDRMRFHSLRSRRCFATPSRPRRRATFTR